MLLPKRRSSSEVLQLVIHRLPQPVNLGFLLCFCYVLLISRGLSALGGGVFVIPCLPAPFFWRDYRQRKVVIAVEKEDQTVDGSQLYLQQKSELQSEERG